MRRWTRLQWISPAPSYSLTSDAGACSISNLFVWAVTWFGIFRFPYTFWSRTGSAVPEKQQQREPMIARPRSTTKTVDISNDLFVFEITLKIQSIYSLSDVDIMFAARLWSEPVLWVMNTHLSSAKRKRRANWANHMASFRPASALSASVYILQWGLLSDRLPSIYADLGRDSQWIARDSILAPRSTLRKPNANPPRICITSGRLSYFLFFFTWINCTHAVIPCRLHAMHTYCITRLCKHIHNLSHVWAYE